jgi:uncharacterized protein YdiU (UPF0061 family)
MRRKLGLMTSQPADQALVQSLLDRMQRNQVDFTLLFRALCDVAHDVSAPSTLRTLFSNPGDCDEWLVQWNARLSDEPREAAVRTAAMRQVNPAFIPRNHRIEQAILAAVEREDFSVFAQLLRVLSEPYQEQPAFQAYAKAPLPSERVLRTFCGT